MLIAHSSDAEEPRGDERRKGKTYFPAGGRSTRGRSRADGEDGVIDDADAILAPGMWASMFGPFNNGDICASIPTLRRGRTRLGCRSNITGLEVSAPFLANVLIRSPLQRHHQQYQYIISREVSASLRLATSGPAEAGRGA